MKRTRLFLASLGAAALMFTGAAAQSAPVVDWQPNSERGAHVSERVFSASGWGSSVTGLSGVANLGRTAPSMLGCTQRTNFRGSNTVASVNIPGVAQLGAVDTFTRTGNANGVETSIGGSQIAGASVLNGTIEFGAITSQARAHRQTNGSYTGSVTTEIASLTVLGNEVEITGGPQTVQVPGVATIVLNSSRVRSTSTGVSSAGTAATIRILETGAEVRLGEVRAGIDGTGISSFFTGQTYGSRLTVGGTVTSGPTALLNMPCLGSAGAPIQAQISGVNLGTVGSVGAVTSTVSAEQTPRYQANASNQVAGASLLGGLASLNGISSEVEVWRNADGTLGYETDAGITSITVAGLNISVPTVPGGTVSLPGVGTLTFHDIQQINSGTLCVRMG